MTTKLGKFLVGRGNITEDQLEKAFRAQLVFGGRLGTNLVELGYITEKVLGEALAEILKVPYATFEHLQEIPASVIHLIPKGLSARYRVVPILREEKTLHLAMIDPKDVLVLDEVSFLTGLRVQPWVAPEIRILEALDRFYTVSRKRRFITLTGELNLMKDREGADTVPSKVKTETVAAAATMELPDQEIGLDGKPIHESAVSPFQEIPSHPPAETLGPSTPQAPLPPSLEQWREVESPAPSPAAVPATVPTADPGISLEEAAEFLARAETRDEVAEAVMKFSQSMLRRVGLFLVQKDKVLAWRWIGNGGPAETLRGISVPRNVPSLFSSIRKAKSLFHGPVAPYPATQTLFSRLKADIPRNAVLLAIPIHGKEAVVLFGDNGREGIGEIDLPALQRIALKASVALEVLILKNKIRML